MPSVVLFTRHPRLKAISIIGYLGMIGGLLALVITRNLFSAFPLIIFLQGASILLFFWARITFGRRSFHLVANPTEGGLVTGGPYRYVRHPIYAAMCLFASAGIAGHVSLGTGLCGGLILASAVVRITCEEVLVTARYPEYASYKAKTCASSPLFIEDSACCSSRFGATWPHRSRLTAPQFTGFEPWSAL